MRFLKELFMLALNFSGRTGRTAYFLAVLFYFFLIGMIGNLEKYKPDLLGQHSEYFFPASMLILFFCIIAVTIRRIHDQDRDWYLIFVFLIPLVGQWVFLMVVFTPGTVGENSYGPDPRGREERESSY